MLAGVIVGHQLRGPLRGSWQRPTASTPASVPRVCGYVWVPSSAFDTSQPTSPPTPTCTDPIRVTTSAPTTPTTTARLPPCGTVDRNGNKVTPCDPTTSPSAGLYAPITIGPFQFAYRDHRNAWTSPSQLTAAQLAWITQQVQAHIGSADDRAANGCDLWNTLAYWFPSGQGKWWSCGQSVDSDYKSADGVAFPVNPLVANVQYGPCPNVPFGVFLFIGGNGNGNKPMLRLEFAPMAVASKTAWSRLFAPLCDALTNPYVDAGTAAAAKIAGPQAAAAAGLSMLTAKAFCPAASPADQLAACPKPQATKSIWSSPLTWLALGGVGVAAWLVLR